MKHSHFLSNLVLLLVAMFAALLGQLHTAAQTDGGDQFLDGIGETAHRPLCAEREHD